MLSVLGLLPSGGCCDDAAGSAGTAHLYLETDGLGLSSACIVASLWRTHVAIFLSAVLQVCLSALYEGRKYRVVVGAQFLVKHAGG